MEEKRFGAWLKILVAATFLGMVAVNALANILPINGIATGQVSDSYPNLFAPAGLTFAIWGLIYLLLAAYTLYCLGLFRKGGESGGLLRGTGIVFALSSLCNTAWIFSWHYRLIPLSMVLMLAILACLIWIALRIGRQPLSLREKIFVRLPFSVYFGWITVATIANATTLLVSLGWDGFGLSETFWTIAILAVGALIGAAAIAVRRDIAYGLVLGWAYAGIWTKHASADGFAGQYPAVIGTVIGCVALFAAAVVYAAVPRRKNKAAAAS